MTAFVEFPRKWLTRGTCRSRRLDFEALEHRRLLAPLMMSEEEQIVIEMINRARSDPAAEAARLGIDLNEGLPAGTISPSPKEPLAANQLLINAARAHSQDMIDRDFYDHDNPDGEDPGDRIRAAGYWPSWWGENINYTYDEYAFHSQLFLSPGHRENILLDNFREVGVGLVYDEYEFVMGTENFGSRDGNPFLTGVVFSDQIVGDNFLTPGENLDNVMVTAQRDGGGATYATSTGPSGGYTLQLPAGVYDLNAEGGDLDEAIIVSDVYVGSWNVKVDFIVPYVPPDVDRYETNNTIASATELGYGDQLLEHLTIHDEYDDDYFRWTAHQDGELSVELDLRRDNGDPSMRLLDTDGSVLRYGAWNEHGSSLTQVVEAGTSYIIQVTAYWSPYSIHRDYDLMIDGPGGLAPQPDSFEPNDDLATAVDIGQGDRTLTGLTAHVPGDCDVFLWTASAGGHVTVEASLGTADEEVQLSLYDAQQQLLDQSSETGATRTVAANVATGESLLVMVEAGDQTLLDDYSLEIDGVMPPLAADDRIWTEPNTPIEINLLLNDQSEDGELDADTLQLVSLPQHGQLEPASADGTFMFSPAQDFMGVDRFTYVMSDDLGNQSAPATVQVTVLNPTNTPWQEPHDALDVNCDEVVSPFDVLLIINYLNQQGAGPLPVPLTTADFPPPFYDVNGDDLASPIDALLIVNYLNTRGSGSGEGEAESDIAPGDYLPTVAPYASGTPVLQGNESHSASPICGDAEVPCYDDVFLTGTDLDVGSEWRLAHDADGLSIERLEKRLDVSGRAADSDLEALLELLAGDLLQTEVR